MTSTLSGPEVLEEQARWADLEQLAADFERQRVLEELAIALAAINNTGHSAGEFDREGAGRTERPSTLAGNMEDVDEEESSNSSS